MKQYGWQSQRPVRDHRVYGDGLEKRLQRHRQPPLDQPLELDKKHVRRISKFLYTMIVGHVLARLDLAAIALNDLLHIRLNVQLQVTTHYIRHLDRN